MSFGGTTAAANQSLKRNAELRRQRSFLREPDYSRWGTTDGIEDTASSATRKRLREQYQSEVRSDRRIRRVGTVLGLAAAVFLLYWMLY
jgi:hypothetical protein